ncbi:hypothetical protein ACFYU8_14260 [Brevibacillus sp. NPDC003359]|uniref:hypothetical protein n=1 Tax=unclassified Brevibacillus TaxID=2684853 RepID=UPI00367BCC9C
MAKSFCKFIQAVKIILIHFQTSYNEVNSRFKEKGEISEALWDTSRGAVEKGKHAFKRPPLNTLPGRTTLDAVSLFPWSRAGMTPMQGAQEARAFSPFSAATDSNDRGIWAPSN